jgi:glutamate--cysteine ligase
LAKQYKASLKRFQLPEFDSSWVAVNRGLEKESLRVTPEGFISVADHPAALGSALTNPYITTDFSEALLEFITPADQSIDKTLGVLSDIHRFTLMNLENDELLWTSSMPCPMGSTEDIRLAQYGNSNIGRLKTLYRSGLSHRYGKLMQVISGLHYNFSMPDQFWPAYQKIRGNTDSLQKFKTDQYLHLIRNFHRNSWLLVYLFGASPAACKCFVDDRDHNLQKMESGSLYLPDATCLRMGDLGYNSEAQKSLFVCYNELDSYVDCLRRAMSTTYPDYENIGQMKNGDYLQMNTSLLQLENEFYSTIRPKRVGKAGQRPLDALVEDGIEYIEVRALDLNPFLPLGIDATQIQFLDTFLLHCLLSESPECHEQEFAEVSENLAAVVERGRDANLSLVRDGKPIKLKQWANELLIDLEHSAALFDEPQGGNSYLNSLNAQQAKVDNPELTPSGQILKQMGEGQQSFFDFAMAQSKKHKRFFLDSKLDSSTINHMVETSKTSLIRQQEIEAADSLEFDKFLEQWNRV